MKNSNILRAAFVFVILTLFSPSSASAVSFDCAKAKTKVDKFICISPTLSKLDDDVNNAYAAAKKRGNADTIISQQRVWLKERNACATPECIEILYKQRLNELCNKHECTTQPSKITNASQSITIETETALLRNQLEILRTIIRHGKYLALEMATGNSYDSKKRDFACMNVQFAILNKSVLEVPIADFSTGKDGNKKILQVLENHFPFLKRASAAKTYASKYAQSMWKPVQDLLTTGKAPNGLLMDAYLFHFKGLEREYVLQWYLINRDAPDKAVYAGRFEFDSRGRPMDFGWIEIQAQIKNNKQLFIPKRQGPLGDLWFLMTAAKIEGKIYFIDLFRGGEEYDSRMQWIYNTPADAHQENKTGKLEDWHLMTVYSPVASLGIMNENNNFRHVGDLSKLNKTADIFGKPSVSKFKFLGEYLIAPKSYTVLDDNYNKGWHWREFLFPGHYLCEFSFYYPFYILKRSK